MDYKIIWTNNAVNEFEEILKYLETEWSIKASNNFKSKLSKTLMIIKESPKAFPTFHYNKILRKAYINKRVSMFYRINNNSILLFIFLIITAILITYYNYRTSAPS